MLKKTLRTTIFIISLLLINHKNYAQEQIGIYVCGFTIHAKGDPNALLMPLRLDNDGRFLFNYGLVVHYKKYFKTRFSFDVIQTFQADCGLLPSAATSISVGYDIVHKKNHRFILGFGPGFYIRKSWTKFEAYQLVNDFRYTKDKKWEYMFFPVVPHIEYTYLPTNSNIGFTYYCIVDPIEHVYNMGLGISILLNKMENKISGSLE